MVENTYCKKSPVNRAGWGAVRWADLSISDASNSWLYTQGDTRNESKSVGLTSLLQKNIKLNDGLNDSSEVKRPALEGVNPNRGEARGFLTINKLVENDEIKAEKLDIFIHNSGNDILGSDGTEKCQSIEGLEFKFGERCTYPAVESGKLDRAAKCLIQGANLNSPKVFGHLSPITKNGIDSPDYLKNKKRNKKHLYEQNENENNYNNSTQLIQNQTCKKIRQSANNTDTLKAHYSIEEFKVSTHPNPEKNSLKKKIQKTLLEINEQKNNVTKFSSETSKTTQLNSDNKSDVIEQSPS